MRAPAEVVAAGLLHDTVEDTSVTLDDLRRDFGETIAKLVDGVTKLTHLPRVPIDVEPIRRTDFPVTEKLIYLNHAGVSPIPSRTAEAAARLLYLFRDEGAFQLRKWLEVSEEARGRFARMIGASPDEAFFVKCDSETNPADVIDAGQLVCLVGVCPVKPAEFVVFKLSQFSAGGAVEDEVGAAVGEALEVLGDGGGVDGLGAGHPAAAHLAERADLAGGYAALAAILDGTGAEEDEAG